jgi:hypothetical protein
MNSGLVTRTMLVFRLITPVSTEADDAPAWQGATTANTERF